ncbi:hypothetical protein BDZ97DRAFT_832186 [Flammula alnicola]|nr:hypothetical protein BDZ97DRAFT_832186 [Flammula alnicola]
MEWIEDPDNLRWFLWLYGPAGSGKSAIAQTIAEMLHAAGILAASFFFSRTAAGRNNDRLFIPTIAFQLCLLIPENREIVGQTVDQDPSIFSRYLPTQLQKLVLNPLNRTLQDEKLMKRLRQRPNVIVIDGLDECGDGESQRRILDALSAAVHQFNIPISFLIASRPELEIRQAFNSNPLSSLMLGLPLDDTYLPNNDIRTFLISKFNQIKEEHSLGIYLPAIWPSKEDLYTLIQKASGQFIYASVVVKYTESPRHRPEDRLGVILGLSPSPASDGPFAVLDALYYQILSSAKEPEKVLEILSFIILWMEVRLHSNGAPLLEGRQKSPCYIEGLMGYQPGDLDILLSDMHAILNIPQDRTREISLYHASLGDFLLDPSRSQTFFIDVKKGHTHIARKYIQLILGRSEASLKSSPVIPILMVHCTESCLTPELSNDLHDIDFLSLIVDNNISGVFELWNSFLHWLREEDASDPTNNLLKIHLEFQDKWLRRQLTVYPTEAQFFLAAAITFEDFMANDLYRKALICLLEQIIHVEQPNLLKDQQSPHGDGVLARIYVRHYPSELTRAISKCFLDPLRAGPLFVDWNKYAILAGALAEFLFRVPGRYKEPP